MSGGATQTVPTCTLPWPNYSSNTFWFSLHQTGDEWSLLIHLPSRECFPCWHQAWHSPSDECHIVTPLSEQECQDAWPGDSSDTSIKCIQCHPYKHLWKTLTFLMTRLQKANNARQICILSQTFKSPASYKNPNILLCLSTASRLHKQRWARNMFCCAHKLFRKDLNIQAATGQASERFNVLFINE